MADYVELRVHGVSGTTPEALLGIKEVGDPVAGDDFVRFVRPVDGDGTLEGMSWGRLTSGSVVQATWLLLLPFAVVNLGYWARAWNAEGRLAGAYRWLLRALGLSLTMTIVFTVAAVSLDLLGWQCMVRDRAACVRVDGWLSWAQGWPNWAVLCLAAALPGVLTLVLAVLSKRSSLRYEAFPGLLGPGDGVADPHLFSRRMWRGDVMVARLRTLHLAVGFATAGAIAAGPAVDAADGPARAAAWLAVVLAVVTVLGCFVLVSASLWLRWTEERTGPAWIGTVAVAGAAVAYALALVSLLGLPPDGGSGLHVPGIIVSGQVIVLGQIGLLVVLLGVVAAGRRLLGRPAVGDAPPEAAPEEVSLQGFAGWFVAALGVILGFAYSAAAVYRVAGFASGTDLGSACEQCVLWVVDLRPAPAFYVAAIGTGLFAVVVPFLLVGIWIQQRGRLPAIVADVRRDYRLDAADIDDADERVQRAVRPRVLAELVSLDRFRWPFLAACLIGIGSGLWSGWLALGSALGQGGPPRWIADRAGPLQTLGTWAVVGFATVLIGLGVLAWRNEQARRLVGILWDVLSFWPRAAHPLAPPCYAERAVPQLACRLQYLSGRGAERPGSVVLAGHSQGSVLSVAALAQLPTAPADDTVDHVALLTFGSPLMRLYAPIFPRVLGRRVLTEPPNRMPVLGPPLRWTSLWRPTDPIGSTLVPLLPAVATAAKTPGDLQLRDPVRLTMDPARSAYAPVRGHSDYDKDPAYPVVLRRLVDLVRRPLTPVAADRAPGSPDPGA